MLGRPNEFERELIRAHRRQRQTWRAVQRLSEHHIEARGIKPVHLRRIDPARNMHRFYRLDVQPDLFLAREGMETHWRAAASFPPRVYRPQTGRAPSRLIQCPPNRGKVRVSNYESLSAAPHEL
jgi:hypothetical protein